MTTESGTTFSNPMFKFLRKLPPFRWFAPACGVPMNVIPFCPELLAETGSGEAEVREKLAALLAGNVRPTAVFGANNLITMAIMKVLKKMAVAIPRDMAVIGFDDWDWAELIDPPVTVVAQPTYDIGLKAAELLLGRIKAKKGKKRLYRPALAVFEPSIIVRKSCGFSSQEEK